MRQRVSFPQSTSSSTARPESRRFQDRPFAAPRSPASPARTLPTFPVRPVQTVPAVTVQRTFKKAVLEDKSRDDLWTDDETDQVYRFVLKGEDSTRSLSPGGTASRSPCRCCARTRRI